MKLEDLTKERFSNLNKLLDAEFKGLTINESALNEQLKDEYLRKVQTIVGSMFSTERELTI